nr:uncharacterized protein LOC126535738 isoform X1 [Dermacentor andersoni]
MNEADSVKNDCECITSAFEAVNKEGSMRTLECYMYTEISQLSEITNKIIKIPKMTKIKQSVHFQVKDMEGVKALELWAIINGAPTNRPPKFISSHYAIETASTDCLLLSYGPPSNGRLKCMLWGLSRKRVNEDTIYFKEAQSLCEEDIYDLTETESTCDHYDIEEEKTVDQIGQDVEANDQPGQ